MAKKILVYVPGFGERYCSDNVEYKFSEYCEDAKNPEYFYFAKKGTDIYHNEYGPAIENKSGSYEYWINGKYHRLNDYAFYDSANNYKSYDVIGKYIGVTKEEFIKKLANVLIPKEEDEQED